MNPEKVSWTQFITFTLFVPASTPPPDLSLIRGGNCWEFVVYKMLGKTNVRYITAGVGRKDYVNIVTSYANVTVIHHCQVILKVAKFLLLI